MADVSLQDIIAGVETVGRTAEQIGTTYGQVTGQQANGGGPPLGTIINDGPQGQPMGGQLSASEAQALLSLIAAQIEDLPGLDVIGKKKKSYAILEPKLRNMGYYLDEDAWMALTRNEVDAIRRQEPGAVGLLAGVVSKRGGMTAGPSAAEVALVDQLAGGTISPSGGCADSQLASSLLGVSDLMGLSLQDTIRLVSHLEILINASDSDLARAAIFARGARGLR